MANKEDLVRVKKEIVDILTKAYKPVASGVTCVYTWAKTWITERHAEEAILRIRQRVMTRLRSIPWLEFARRYRWPVGLGVLLILWAIAIWKVPQWHAASWKDLKDSKDIASLVSDTRATVVELVGSLLVLGGLFFAWRNLRALQEQIGVTQKQIEVTQTTHQEQIEVTQEQIEVTQTTHAVERFVRLRERAISREHSDLERRVAALLRHLDGLALTPEDLDYAPDINLYLNDYLWIGRFVRRELIPEEFARATYGRSLHILYPKLKPYIERERRLRQFPTLWNDVDWLYEMFKKSYPVAFDPEVVQREMERWINPATRLTTGHLVDVVGLVTGKQVLTRFEFEGRDSNIYRADYYRFFGSPQDPSRQNLGLPRLKDLRSQIEKLAECIFPLYGQPGINNLIKKFDTFSTFALVYNNSGGLVAFNIYKVAEVVSDVGPAKTVYVEHAGTHPDVQGRGITQAVRNEFYRQENPAVICGSSAHGAIYVVNTHIANMRRMVLYPTGPKTPAPIVELANQIHDSLDLRNAELDDRLVRSYKTQISKGDMIHPLKGSLPLCPNQHIFYMLLAKKLDQALLRGQMR